MEQKDDGSKPTVQLEALQSSDKWLFGLGDFVVLGCAIWVGIMTLGFVIDYIQRGKPGSHPKVDAVFDGIGLLISLLAYSDHRRWMRKRR